MNIGKAKSLILSVFFGLFLFSLSSASVVIAGSTIYSPSWAGFTFYKSNTQVTSASAYLDVPTCSLPPEEQLASGVPIIVGGWVGVSINYGGGGLLIQGGWGSFNISSTFYYYTWSMVYPGTDEIFFKWTSSGTEHGTIVSKKWENSTHVRWRVLVGTNYTDYIISPKPQIRYAHFILETPSVNGIRAQLPRFTDEYMWMCYVATTSGGNYGTYYYNNGWYYKWIMKQGDYVNTGVEYLPFPVDDDATHISWITSER